MSDLSYDDVRKILALIENSTLEEIHVELDGFKLDVRRRGTGAPSAPPPPQPASPKTTARTDINVRPGQFALVAPMLGTFYCAPAPDALPFVAVGKIVVAEDPLCIIEVMKLMNTIKAERPGRVAAILAENGTMVEFGQTLIVFDPL